MKKILRIFWPSVETTVPVKVSPDAETLERFNVVSQFILESQKQYFDSLRFSLNMWVVINSGAGIAILSGPLTDIKSCFGAFMFGALAAGVGNLMLFCASNLMLSNSYKFCTDNRVLYDDFLKKHHTDYKKLFRVSFSLLFCSYGCFTFGFINLVYLM